MPFRWFVVVPILRIRSLLPGASLLLLHNLTGISMLVDPSGSVQMPILPLLDFPSLKTSDISETRWFLASRQSMYRKQGNNTIQYNSAGSKCWCLVLQVIPTRLICSCWTKVDASRCLIVCRSSWGFTLMPEGPGSILVAICFLLSSDNACC
jgi:hypothetical protein